MAAEDRLKELGIELPTAPSPAGNYVMTVRTGNLLVVCGHGPGPDCPAGKLGRDLTIEQGYEAARQVGLNILASVRQSLGSLDRVTRVVKVLGMVNSDPSFGDQPKVMNGCSDLLVEVFGDAGKHTRSAVGFVSLPNQIPVEIECMLEVE